MIVSYRDALTDAISRGASPKGAPTDILKVVLRKLKILNSAINLDDLRSPPGNRLEQLVGDRAGQYSIRVNDQWRLCFHWIDGNAHNVELVD